MSKKKVQPCAECPFRKTSLPGWLGPGTGKPEIFLAFLEYNVLHCHTVPANYGTDGKSFVHVKHPCIGAMQYLANSCKFPRGAREAGSQYEQLFDKYSHPNVRVFKWSNEFIAYHTIPIPLTKRKVK